jgi:hypothetical protein
MELTVASRHCADAAHSCAEILDFNRFKSDLLTPDSYVETAKDSYDAGGEGMSALLIWSSKKLYTALVKPPFPGSTLSLRKQKVLWVDFSTVAPESLQ